VELKLRETLIHANVVNAFNRTIVELKLIRRIAELKGLAAFNRTIVELKYRLGGFFNKLGCLLTEP